MVYFNCILAKFEQNILYCRHNVLHKCCTAPLFLVVMEFGLFLGANIVTLCRSSTAHGGAGWRQLFAFPDLHAPKVVRLKLTHPWKGTFHEI